MTIRERNEIVLDNMNLVHFIAHKMYLSPYTYYSYEDIVQEGMIGLIKAAENFNPELGFAFSTYASMMIRGYMLRFIRDNQYRVKYSRSDLDAYVKFQRSGKEINEITSEDLDALGIDPKHLPAIMSMMSSTSLDAPIKDEDSSASVLDLVPSVSDELSEKFYEDEMDKIKDSVLHSMTSDTARDICEEWYYSQQLGMPAKQPYLAAKYKISQAQVSRTLRKFKNNLLDKLESSGYEVPDYLTE